MEIIRDKELKILGERLEYFPVVAILGSRQCGKTTLARQFAHQHPAEQIHTFDLEDTTDLAKLENPTLTLAPLTGISEKLCNLIHGEVDCQRVVQKTRCLKWRL